MRKRVEATGSREDTQVAYSNETPYASFNRLFRVITRYAFAWFFLLPSLAIATWNVWTGYSLWVDEIFSVTVSSMSWRELFAHILNDVHPPLYQVLLKLWIGIFGNGEVAVRSLSLLFAVLTLVLPYQLFKRKGPVFASSFLAFLGSSWLFLYYAQEVRSYAVLLFLATLTLIAFERRNDPRRGGRVLWYAVLVATSLVHYFGLIYAGLFLIYDLLSCRTVRSALERVAVGALMWVWPAIHVAFGTVSDRTGGDFWIDAGGGDQVAWMASKVLNGVVITGFAKIVALPFPFFWLVPTLLTIIVVVYVVVRFDLLKTHPTAVACGFVIAAAVGTLTAVNSHTPITTVRNLIVLIPLGAFLFASLADVLWKAAASSSVRTAFPLRAVLAVAVLGYFALSLKAGVDRMQERWEPRENWKAMAEAIRHDDLCTPHCLLTGPDPETGVLHYTYYFGAEIGTPIRDVVHTEEALLSSPKNDLPIIVIRANKEIRPSLIDRYDDRRCLEPAQSWKGNLFILVDDLDEVSSLNECSSW